MELGRLQEPLRRVDEVRVDGQPVESPRAIRELLHAGELALGVAGEPFPIGEVVLGTREVQRECLLRRGQLLGAEEALQQREAPLAHLGEGGVGNPHRSGTLCQRHPAIGPTPPCGAPTLTVCAQ